MTDFAKLRLKHHGDPERLFEILQMECREKTAKKLPTFAANPDFVFPSIALAEMSTSEEVAKIHAEMIKEGDTVADLTFGLGIDAFALAEKARRVVGVEIDPSAAKIAEQNAKALGISNVEIVCADCMDWLKGTDEHFDVIFIDPARRDSAGRHFRFSDCSPDIVSNLPLLLSHCRKLIIKASPMIDISLARQELQQPKADAVVIGTEHECKEVVMVISPEQSGSTKAITLGHGAYVGNPSRKAVIATVNPSAGFLYEPFPAVMKAGLMNEIDLGTKLHPSSHLFYSPSPLPDFPGQEFRILASFPFNKQGIKELAKAYPVTNVAVRNLPIKAPELAKRLKVKEGGRLKTFGTTLANDEKVMIVTEF